MVPFNVGSILVNPSLLIGGGFWPLWTDSHHVSPRGEAPLYEKTGVEKNMGEHSPPHFVTSK